MSQNTGLRAAVDITSNEPLRARVAELEKKVVAAALTDTARKGTEATLRDALAYVQTIVDTVREPLLVLDRQLKVKTASLAFYQGFGVSEEETTGQFIYELGNGQWNIAALRTSLEEVLIQGKSFRDFEVMHEFPVPGSRVMLLNARKMCGSNLTELVLLAIEDITERKRILEELLRSNEELQRFAYVASHDLCSPVDTALRGSQLLAPTCVAPVMGRTTSSTNSWLSNSQADPTMIHLGKRLALPPRHRPLIFLQREVVR